MKSWLAQGSSGRRVTLLPGTTFLHINGALVEAALLFNRSLLRVLCLKLSVIHGDFLLPTHICLSGACVLIHSIRQCFPYVIGIAIMATILPRFLLQILEELTLIETFHTTCLNYSWATATISSLSCHINKRMITN